MRVTITTAAMMTAALATIAASAASAQVTQTSERQTELRLSVEAQHDSNVARRNAAEASRLGLSRADERTTPSAALFIVRPIGRHSIQIDAQAGYDFYRRNKRLNRERLSLGGKGILEFGACALDLTTNVSRRQSDLTDIAAALVQSAASVKNAQTLQDYGGSVRCGRNYGLQPTLTVDRAIGENSNPLRQVSNYRSFTYGGGLSYIQPVLGRFSAILSSTKTDYPDRTMLAGGSGFKVVRGKLSAERDIGAILQASGSISYIHLRPDGVGVASFGGVGWSVGVTALPTPDLKLNASTSRDVTPSLGTDALYQQVRSFDAGATYALGARTSFGIDGSIRTLDYLGASTTFGPLLTHSVQHSVSARATQQFASRVEVMLQAGYQKRTTDLPLYDFDNFFAGLRLSFVL